MPDVTAIIPVHNGRAYVAQALESVLNQTHRPVLTVVIDDGSTDGSAEIVQPYLNDPRGKVELITQSQSGVSRARNAGIEAARGEFLAFLDADDLWLPKKLAAQLDLLARHPEAVGAICRPFFFKDQLDDLGRPLWDRPIDNPDLTHILRYQAVIMSAVVVRRSLLGNVRFDERTGHAEDTIFAAELRWAGPWRMVDQPLLARREHDQQATRSAWHVIHNVQTRVRWLRAHRQQVGTELADQLEHEFGFGLVAAIEKRYWNRDTAGLAAMCQRVRQICPDLFAQSFLARRHIYPSWVYRLRDAVRGGAKS